MKIQVLISSALLFASTFVFAQTPAQCEQYKKLSKEFVNNDPTVYGISPFSDRAIGFAKQYQRMSVAVHQYLGEPRVITSLAFEPHVVKQVSIDLKKLETAIAAGKALRASQKDPAAFLQFAKMISGLATSGMLKAVLRVGIMPFLENNPADWGWHHLDKINKALEDMHSHMAGMNMMIFLFMSSESTSPLHAYFEKLASCDPNFNGEMTFANDNEGLLKAAFKRLFDMKATTDLEERKRLSWEFSVLLIAHEQVYAQEFYDRIKDQHQKLSGLFQVVDPVGTYDLADMSWSDFRVRFSLDLNKPVDIAHLTANEILGIQLRPGTIPDYYKNRIYAPTSLRFLQEPVWNEKTTIKPWSPKIEDIRY